MRQVICAKCQQTVPMQQSFLRDDETLCEACCGEIERTAANTPSKPPVRQIDPTICQRCGNDNSVTLPTVAHLHACPDCAQVMLNFPFPRWVKASAAGLLALVVFSAVWNMRFLLAVYEGRRCVAVLFGQGDFATAERLAYSAYDRVPEDRTLQALASFFRGVTALKNDDSKEAVAFLRNADEVLPDKHYGTGGLLQQALRGVAFDEKDYDTFLSLSRELAEQHPKDFMAQLSLASAYACQYAVTGETKSREQTLQTLEKARSLEGADDPWFSEYEQRIMHRLETREIISPKEFQQRFPDGWTKQEEAAP